MTITNIFQTSDGENESDVTTANGNAANADPSEESMDTESSSGGSPELIRNGCELSINPNGARLRRAHMYPSPRSQTELSQEIVDTVENEFHNRPDTDLISRYKGATWLDDENIDQYLALIKQRNERNLGYPSIYHFRCTFYSLLKTKHTREGGYASVARCAEGEDIFSYKLVLFPCEISGHWRMVVMDVPKKTLLLYDSLNGEHEGLKCLKNIAYYLKREFERVEKVKAEVAVPEGQSIGNPDQNQNYITAQKREINRKVKSFFDAKVWTVKIVDPMDIPRQANSNDCGVFLLQYAEYLSRRQSFDFTQVHMPYFRLKMAYESSVGELMIQ